MKNTILIFFLTPLCWAFAVVADAGPIDPTSYTSLGSYALLAGGSPYILDTTSAQAPTISGNGISITGVVDQGVAIFDFDRLSVGPGVQIMDVTAFSSLPVAFLSRSTMTIAGTIDVSAASYAGGPGQSTAGFGQNGDARTTPAGLYSAGGGGGSFGGTGGFGADAIVPGGSRVAGGRGGAPYGDLAVQLQGGSQGAPGGYGPGSMSGGGGGGGIELGASGLLSISGSILARGGDGYVPGSGGGSGGGIFLHAPSLNVSGILDVSGGAGAAGIAFNGTPVYMGGGGGGGGRITTLSADGSPVLGTLLLGGGSGGASYPDATQVGGAGSMGVYSYGPLATVPEPTSLAMLISSMLCLAGLRLRSHLTRG